MLFLYIVCCWLWGMFKLIMLQDDNDDKIWFIDHAQKGQIHRLHAWKIFEITFLLAAARIL